MTTALRLRRYLLTGLAACACGATLADDFHYNNMLIGDRASGMGGAYTGVSDDATGLFYNPAGVAYTRGRNINASVNAFHMTNIAYEDVLGGGDWTRESSSLLPNFFGIVQPLGNGVAGLSYAVTDAIQENLDQTFHLPGIAEDYVINLNNNDSTYKLGPSYAVRLRDGLTVGITLYGHLRETETIMNQVITGIQSGVQYEWTTAYMQSSEAGVEPIIGVMWTPMEKLSLGATLRKIEIINSDFESQYTCVSDYASSPCTSTTPTSLFGESSDERPYPLTFSLGAAYFPSERLLYTADFVYYNQADGKKGDNINDPFRTRAATWNASIGAEYYFSNHWALRSGVFTNNANTPSISAGGRNQPEHVDMLGFAGSLSRFSRDYSITVGFAWVRGEGDAQIVSGVNDIQNVNITTKTFFLSTSYTY